MEVWWEGELVDTIEKQANGGSDWTTFNYQVTAGDPAQLGDLSGKLEFRSIGDNDRGGELLDQVSLMVAEDNVSERRIGEGDWEPITVKNAGFEDDNLAEKGKDRVTTAPSDWDATGQKSGAFNMYDSDYDPQTVQRGSSAGFIDFEGTLSQELDQVFEMNKDYRLTVAVGNDLGRGDSDSWEIRLYAGDTIVGSTGAADHPIKNGQMVDVELSLSAEELQKYENLNGSNLKIEFYDSNTGSKTNAHFDDVRLDTRLVKFGGNAYSDSGPEWF